MACSVVVVSSQTPATATAASQIADQARNAAAVPDEGIYDIYQNHSWLWGDNGAAFFAAKQRTFSAWTSDKGKQGSAEGTWFIPGGGKLCFRATWHGSWGAKSDTTCFEHRQAGKVIYQRKLPNGDWYVFKSADRDSGDEFRKVKYGDYVTRKQ